MLMAMEQDQQSAPDASLDAVRAGMNIRPDFWDDFIRLTGNAEALSELLDVPRDKIAGWAAKITQSLELVQQADGPGDRSKTLGTGD
jgi:hypothetical protein